MQPHLVTGPSFRRRCRDPIDIAQVAILLDVDGTILDVAATPQSVVVPRIAGSNARRVCTRGPMARSRSSAAGSSKISMICSCRSSCLVSADMASNCAFRAMLPCRGGMPS